MHAAACRLRGLSLHSAYCSVLLLDSPGRIPSYRVRFHPSALAVEVSLTNSHRQATSPGQLSVVLERLYRLFYSMLAFYSGLEAAFNHLQCELHPGLPCPSRVDHVRRLSYSGYFDFLSSFSLSFFL